MTPKKLDIALKNIRRTRNLMIFFGFIPMIYLFGCALMATSSLDVQYLMVEAITAMIIVGFTWGIIRIKKYISIVSKVGLALLGLSFLGIILTTFVPYSEILWVVLGGLHLIGLAMFVMSAKIHWSLKLTYFGYYILMALFVTDALIYGVSIKHDSTAYIGIATLIYPMLSSYLAVRWANKEFFKLMNNEE
jgi:hypothetical protein